MLADVGLPALFGDGLGAEWVLLIDLGRLGLTDACLRNAGAFSAPQKAYLAHHRKYVFKE